MRKRVRGLAGVKDALLCPGKSQIYVIARPIRAKTELAGGLGDTDPEALLSVGKLQRAELEHEGAVDVVHVLGALAVGEERAEDHHGATVCEEAHLAPERAVQPLVDIGERLHEHFAHERNVVHVFQRRSDGCRRCICYHPRFCLMQHRYGHMYDGHDGGLNRLPCGYGYGLGEGVEGHFGFGREAWVDEVGQGNL